MKLKQSASLYLRVVRVQVMTVMLTSFLLAIADLESGTGINRQ